MIRSISASVTLTSSSRAVITPHHTLAGRRNRHAPSRDGRRQVPSPAWDLGSVGAVTSPRMGTVYSPGLASEATLEPRAGYRRLRPTAGQGTAQPEAEDA